MCLYYIKRCAWGQEEKTKWRGWWNTILQVCVKIWHQQRICRGAFFIARSRSWTIQNDAPKLLHTYGNGLIMYMLKLLRYQLRGGKDHDYIDWEHVVVSNKFKCQSECDFPRGSMRNGLIDGTKRQSSERTGNLFWLLCIVHKTKSRNVLQTALQLSDQQWSKFLLFIKMYLAMEEWFHDCKWQGWGQCTSEIKNKTILMGHPISCCHAPVVRSFFIHGKMIISS